jgi:phenylpropionate dioxygenase-like ring-hydroxylating dioxygenase large terminal subunit
MVVPAEQHAPQWKEGYSLPQAEYSDPNIFNMDMRLLSEGLWLLIDHESAIPAAGDYFRTKIGEEEIILVRGKDMVVRGFFNVCRHRGSRICLTDQGSAKALVCPYHGWTYDLDGKLRGAALMPADFDKTENGLMAFSVRVEDGLIFVNLSRGAAPDFEDFIAPFRPFLAIHGLSDTKVALRKAYPTIANWKLLVENFFECYHCRTAHPSYCKVHDPRKLLAFGAGPGSGDGGLVDSYMPIFDKWQDEERQAGTLIDMFSDDEKSMHFRSAGRMPIGEGALTESIDGQPVAPLIGAAREKGQYDGNQSGMVFNPVSTLLVSSDHAVIFKFIPTGPLTSLCEAIWLVNKDAEEGIDYDPEKLSALWEVTLSEDKVITENNQKGVLSSAYKPGRYSTQEQRIADFGRWYMRRRGEFS